MGLDRTCARCVLVRMVRLRGAKVDYVWVFAGQVEHAANGMSSRIRIRWTTCTWQAEHVAEHRPTLTAAGHQASPAAPHHPSTAPPSSSMIVPKCKIKHSRHEFNMPTTPPLT
jgi:hypothetical protein